MRDELEEKLMKRFPFMEAKSFLDGERLGHCVPCECSDGWYELIYYLCKEIEILYELKNKDVMSLNIEQIKEKYGKLRFYVGNYIDGVMEIVNKYEALSTKTCEVCGKEGKLTGKRWVRTLCEDCCKV